MFTINIKSQQSVVTKDCNFSSIINVSLKISYLIKHQLAVILKASNVLLSQFKVTIKIIYSNNLEKKNSQTLERNIFLITDGRYMSIVAYIDQNIIIVESDGYDVTASYRHIPNHTDLFPRKCLWRHKLERDLTNHW